MKTLGVQLLLRTTRQVSLTSAGAVYAARVEPLIRQFDQVRDDLREEQGDVAGLIRINAPLSLGQQLLPDIVSGFRAEHPQVSVSLSLTDRFIDIVSERFDLALRVSEAPRDRSTIWRKVCRVRRILVASPGYLAIFGTPETPDDLSRHGCIAYDEEAISETWELTNGGRTRKALAGKVLAANNGELIAKLVEDGQGLALLPHFIVGDALASARRAEAGPCRVGASGALADIVLSALRETADARCEILGLLRKICYPYAPAVKKRRTQVLFSRRKASFPAKGEHMLQEFDDALRHASFESDLNGLYAALLLSRSFGSSESRIRSLGRSLPDLSQQKSRFVWRRE